MNTLTSKATAIAPKTVFDRLGQLDDISHQIGKMPRDEAILRPHCLKDGRIQYQGLIRLSGSGYYYSVVFWLSSLEPPKGGIKFTPWKRVHPRTNQEPVPDARVVSAKVVLAPDGTHLEGRTERARIRLWPRLARDKQVFELILAARKSSPRERMASEEVERA